MEANRLDDQLARVRARLHEQFDGRVDPSVVDDVVMTATARFEHARITTYVPTLVDRLARDKLRHHTADRMATAAG
jgi:hypothetical protein